MADSRLIEPLNSPRLVVEAKRKVADAAVFEDNKRANIHRLCHERCLCGALDRLRVASCHFTRDSFGSLDSDVCKAKRAGVAPSQSVVVGRTWCRCVVIRGGHYGFLSDQQLIDTRRTSAIKGYLGVTGNQSWNVIFKLPARPAARVHGGVRPSPVSTINTTLLSQV